MTPQAVTIHKGLVAPDWTRCHLTLAHLNVLHAALGALRLRESRTLAQGNALLAADEQKAFQDLIRFVEGQRHYTVEDIREVCGRLGYRPGVVVEWLHDNRVEHVILHSYPWYDPEVDRLFVTAESVSDGLSSLGSIEVTSLGDVVAT